MKTKTAKPNKVNVVTLGCSKNLVDSENIITQLKANDYEVMHDSNEEAGIVIVNTCGFIDLAKEESIQTILNYAHLKSLGMIDKLYVTGCLSHRYKSDLEKEIPEVDAYFGTMELPGLMAKLNADYKHELIGERWITTPSHYAYLKISEGCNRTCAFCAIPLMRGNHKSKSIESLVKESKHLAAMGTKEIILIAQELTYYGLDIYKRRALSDLLNALCEVEGIEWIRLHYAYPSKFPVDILDVIQAQNKICKYLDIPLQHASDPMLSAMKRQITRVEQKELIKTIRNRVPGIKIRSTFLVGFPGETEEDFEVLLDFIRESRLERVGVFQYSHEEGTSAFSMKDDVDTEVKAERAHRLMEVQQEISFAANQAMVGKEMKVLIDRKEGDFFVGRTEFDSPEVDNEVLIPADRFYVRVGDFAKVSIIDADEYDLHAEVLPA
ncbi:MAG TPA: 30S ribosomal protein S12 methylthiotransferase RimO [Saprospiraceae bacterium]|nr:30S ribosomal protein S12 methylthiotransferase RimO [Saprospiraceae bacterium]